MKVEELINGNLELKSALKTCPPGILEKWEVKSYPKDYIICNQGEKSNYFYYIVEGYLSIYRMAEDGSKYIQSIYKPGNYFGELEIFNQEPYVCAVRTMTESKIIRLYRDYFMEWIKKDQDYLLYLTKTLCDNFYELSKKAGEDMLYSLKHRVCNYIVFRLHQADKMENGVKIKVDKRQLANRLAVTKRSVNRVFRKIAKDGIVKLIKGKILIEDIKALEELAAETRLK